MDIIENCFLLIILMCFGFATLSLQQFHRNHRPKQCFKEPMPRIDNSIILMGLSIKKIYGRFSTNV